MFIGVDIGGSSSRVALFVSPAKPKIIKRIQFRNSGNYSKDFENLCEAIAKLTSKKIEGIGVGVAGMLNLAKTSLKLSPNLLGWSRKPLQKDLARKFRCEVILENDATVASLGEALFGESRGKDFLFVIWGSGIGGSFVSFENEKKKPKLENFEIGHQLLDARGGKCGCGKRGCLEVFCGGKGISKHYKKEAKNLNEKEWKEVCANFAKGLQKVIEARQPSLIVFGGGIACKQNKRVKQIAKLLPTKIKITKLKENVGLVGSLGLFRKIR
ncbi:ROK family protein [Patescibacteria group bacterium]|nr:ROK family protein [Patescibacteria group bacterium]